MRAKKVDENQKRLVEALRQVPGVRVSHTHMIGKGFPDIVVGYKGRNYLFEIKNPRQPKSGRKLTEDEERWHEEWTGQVDKVETVYEIINIINEAVYTSNRV